MPSLMQAWRALLLIAFPFLLLSTVLVRDFYCNDLCLNPTSLSKVLSHMILRIAELDSIKTSLVHNYPSSHNCSAGAFTPPTVFGAEIVSIEASLVQNYTARVPGAYYFGHGDINATSLSFCNVTVEHTHPGQNDSVLTQVWLPTEWNGRMQAIGGGGWIAGMFLLTDFGMAGATAESYAALTTNGGVPQDPKEWALLSPGNINLYSLQNFASVSLNDASIIGKSLIQSFYGQPPKYSYWSGCSQGGRQGLMLAQRYPKAFNGIQASAPAINWPELFVGDFFPRQVMSEFGEYPHPCELNALTTAAVQACDEMDGLIDGIIADPDLCQFDPDTMVGSAINCSDSGTTVRVSKAAAAVAKAVWTGARGTNDSFLWYGPGPAAIMTGPTGLATTECSTNGTCAAGPLPLFTDWMTLFVKKDTAFNVSRMTRREYENIFRAGVREFESIIGSNYPDLTEFRDAGGKMIGYHGLADPIIPYNNTRHYYETVTAVDPSVHDYYRVFEAPGLEHCYGGRGAYPTEIFDKLVEWVETGKAPDVLTGTSCLDEGCIPKEGILCPYPQKVRYNGTRNSSSLDSFYCAE